MPIAYQILQPSAARPANVSPIFQNHPNLIGGNGSTGGAALVLWTDVAI
ncbi:MAG: hypothetical protein H6655_27175 [Ardenticatenaceae bacterium]|nr:hypothetical protein [Ardenticatenaceae bacterium]